jgi:hypothetical protein
MPISEYIEDIPGSDHLKDLWGERFRGWYQTTLFKKTELISLEVQELTYQIKICEFQFRFIMPPRIEFIRGLNPEGNVEYGVIDYSTEQRLLGVFRFPMDEKGFFTSPLSMERIREKFMILSEQEMKDLINKKKVLTFEAFRVPFFGFEYFLMKENDFNEITILAGDVVSNTIRSSYEKEMTARMQAAKEKIESLPNDLLILQNILDRKYTNEKEISEMTGGIIHFGI